MASAAGSTAHRAGVDAGAAEAPLIAASRDRPTIAIIAAATLLAAAVTLYQLSRPGYVFGLTPDISAWFGASVRLLHGTLPYRDFGLTQPPGFAVLASPFAALSELIGTRDALAILRLCTPLIAAATVLLTGAVIRGRGRLATLTACGVMAVFPAQLYALSAGLLEPVVNLLCLAGIALVVDGGELTASRRRLVLGGMAFGGAVLVKLPALLPLGVVAVLCLPQIRRRLLPFAGGAVATVVVAGAPFILAAPSAFFTDVVGTQLGRVGATGRTPLGERLGDMTAVSALGGGSTAAIVTGVALAGIVIAAFAVSRRRPSRFEWFVLAATAAVGAAQLGPAWYYPQYTAFFAPFLALTLGLAVARLTETGIRRIVPPLATAAVVALSAGELLLIHGEAVGDVAPAVDAVVPAGGCTLSDSPKYLVTTDRLVAASPWCTTMTDPQGATLALAGNQAASLAMWEAAFAHTDYVVTDAPVGSWFMPQSAALRQYVAANFREVSAGGLIFYVRPAGGGAPALLPRVARG